MSKYYPPHKSCYALLQVLDEAGATKENPLHNKIAFTKAEEKLKGELKEIDFTKNKSGRIHWQNNLFLYLINYKHAKVFFRKGGFWHITEYGRQLLQEKDWEEIKEIVNKKESEWEAKNGKKSKTIKKIESTEENTAELSLEEFQSNALQTITDKLKKLDAYEFQDLVAELLKAIGYFVDESDIASRGADGGIDITAYKDKLQMDVSVFVQVKHNIISDVAIPPNAIQSLSGAISQRASGGKGLFVCSTRFTKGAQNSAKQLNIKLIDLSHLLELWYENYNKISEKGKKLLPITKVYFCIEEE